MATLARPPRALRLPSEGRLSAQPLDTLLTTLDLVRATGVLDISRRKLTRRFVLEGGRLAAIVSNMREDRLFEWLDAQGRLKDVDPDLLDAVRARLDERPLSAGEMLAVGLLDATRLARDQRDHAAALVADCAAQRDASFSIRPGRLDLGPEPRIDIGLIALALPLARARQGGATMPYEVQTVPEIDERMWEEFELDPREAQLLEAARRAQTPRSLSDSLPEIDAATQIKSLGTLFRAGLIGPADPVVESTTEAFAEVTEKDLTVWLSAAENHDLHGLVGTPAGTPINEIRRAYYRNVRRFHPDRYRTGPLAHYYKEIENAFRLLHEAVELLTDPVARQMWERRRRESQQASDPLRAVRELFQQAQAAAERGRRVEAVELLERGRRIAPEDTATVVSLALLMCGNPRRRTEAAELLAELMRRRPGQVEVMAALALCLQKTGQEAEGRSWLGKARETDPSNAIVRALSGDAAAREQAARDPFMGPLFARS